MEGLSLKDCNCSSDCSGTYFSVIETKVSISEPGHYCNNYITKKTGKYPYSVFCKMCVKMIKKFRAKFSYEHVVNGGPNPLTLDVFCNEILTKNIALVKVEMATKHLTKSVKDMRFNFVSKLSTLGE